MSMQKPKTQPEVPKEKSPAGNVPEAPPSNQDGDPGAGLQDIHEPSPTEN